MTRVEYLPQAVDEITGIIMAIDEDRTSLPIAQERVMAFTSLTEATELLMAVMEFLKTLQERVTIFTSLTELLMTIMEFLKPPPERVTAFTSLTEATELLRTVMESLASTLNETATNADVDYP